MNVALPRDSPRTCQMPSQTLKKLFSCLEARAATGLDELF